MPTGVNKSEADGAHSTSATTVRALGPLPDSLWPSILDAISASVSVHSGAGAIMWANKELCGLYRNSLSNLRGLSCHELFHADDPSCPHEEVLTAGSAVRPAREVRVFGRILAVTIEPLVGEDDRILGFVRVMQETTRPNHAHEQLLLAERFATLGQLLSVVAHDVGTPLNVISGYAEYLLMRAEPSGQGFKELQAILDQTRRIAAMFNQVLDLAGSPQGRTEAIDIRALLTDSLDLVGRHLRKASVKTDLTCRMVPPLIYGEAAQLRQALFNLLLNAGQQVGPGGRLQLEILEADELPGFLGLSLFGTESSGVGRDFSQSFAGFLARAAKLEASGIGLSLAKGILDEAGARIAPAPAEGQGVGLKIFLPVSAGSRA